MFTNKKIALAGALALAFAGSAQAVQQLSCANPSITINTSAATEWSGGSAIGSFYGDLTATGPITIHANFDIATTLTPAQLATIKVALSGVANFELTGIASPGVTFTGLPTFPVISAVSVPDMTTAGFTTGTGKSIDLTLDIGAIGGAGYDGTVTVSVTCGPAGSAVSAVPASNPWTLAALGGVLAIAGGGAAAARRRKAQNPSA